MELSVAITHFEAVTQLSPWQQQKPFHA